MCNFRIQRIRATFGDRGVGRAYDAIQDLEYGCVFLAVVTSPIDRESCASSPGSSLLGCRCVQCLLAVAFSRVSPFPICFVS
jgi:hypothetical protein